MEPHAEPVVDKEQSNFCEYYSANKNTGSKAPAGTEPAADPFESLFKK
jgi:hypothetical protein